MGTWPVTYQLSFNNPAELDQTNGVIFNESSVPISAITDGTSNTFLFGEHAKTNQITFDPGFAVSDGQWNSGRNYDTMVSTYLGPNPGIGSTNEGGAANIIKGGFYPEAAEQPAPRRREHGVRRRLGPVRQELDQLVVVQRHTPRRRDARELHLLRRAGTQIGVWQQLSTRNGGEVVSSDQY